MRLATTQYDKYLSLSNFNSALAGKLNYYLLGSLFGLARGSVQPSRIYGANCGPRHMRGSVIVTGCGKVTMTPQSNAIRRSRLIPGSFRQLSAWLVFTEQYNPLEARHCCKRHGKYFDAVIAINPDTDEAQRSRKYVAQH